MTVESYIVRIYRREGDGAVAGVVENALSRKRGAFRSMDELIGWLRRPPRAFRRRASGGAGDPVPGDRDANARSSRVGTRR
jgi:hypothetical protein